MSRNTLVMSIAGRMKRGVFLGSIVALSMGGTVVNLAAQGEEASAVVFRHRYRLDEQYRIVGVNEQELFLDGVAVADAETLTRIQLRVSTVAGEGDSAEGEIEAHYQVSEEIRQSNEPFQLEREYGVTFGQDAFGVQDVPRSAFVPQVRSVPTFPEDAVRPADTWTAPGIEVYDFREGLEIPDPVRIPIEPTYEYIGPATVDGTELHELRIRYNLFYRPPTSRPESAEIRLITARFNQTMLWDNLAGRAHSYEETYNLFIQLTDGSRLEYRGRADGRVVGAPPLDRERLRRELEDAMAAEQIADTSVREDEEGITIAFEDIQFAPDSAVLLDSELHKIEVLSRVLARYPDRDLLITGHTALAGTAAGRQQLSEERARAVGQALIDMGVRTRESLVYRGFGARQPLADNSTSEGRRRNRRVEITILEN